LKRTIEPTTNPEPLIVKLAPGSPALTLDGEILLTVEAGINGELWKNPLIRFPPETLIKGDNECDSE
jgi:hypothetical protein